MAKEDDRVRSTDKDDDLRSFRKGRISKESQEQGGYCPHCGRGDRRKSSSSESTSGSQAQTGRKGGQSLREP